MDREVFFLYAESQIHAGKGTDVGVVDSPIQRERTTNFPVIQGVKGSLRNSGFFGKDEEIQIFGSEPKSDETHPGGFAFSEAKILLFPVRNPEKVFVWVICPMVLKRFLRSMGKDIEIPEVSDDEKVITAESFTGDNIWLEELEFKVQKNSKLAQIVEILSDCGPDEYTRKKIKESKDIFIVSDSIFQKIVETMTEIVPRIKIDNTKGTVAELWYEEYLPQDTVMYFIVRKLNSSNSKNLVEKINGKLISIGGKETVGKGLAWIKKVES
ncbi:hypothetical protein AT15_06325 [Kosmotoga arenicorallina S304]|uniref:CRISPR type III-associated protein domain-containing protein n=1 Tax=Kosmotoga arenicorallina S304 TaxID=1453497 RepID=A0A176JTQ1_9BACT|nr:type III-B CRISPR module RAMP protein Cmr4 [Kosmotoga arenicorallina]OAA26688.1 hypothetical protein AT15_06325 [Kosmotoga arenicorallina S304]